MNKILLLAGATAVFAFSFEANACDLKPYISAKINAASVNNKIKMSLAEFYNMEPENTRIWDYFRGDEHDSTWGFSLAAGIKKELEKGAVRAEFEFTRFQPASSYVTHRRNQIKYKTQIHSYMINTYYDFDTGSAFTPYIGGGIGYAKTKFSATHWEIGTETSSHTNFAWQIGGGIAYAVNDNVSIDVGYRYVDYGKIDKITDIVSYGVLGSDFYKTSIDTSANELYAGIRYTF